MRPIAWLILFAGLALARAGADEDPRPFPARWQVAAATDIAVPEVSGLVALPSSTATARVLLAVSDEGRLDVATDRIADALWVVALGIDEAGRALVGEPRPVVLHARGALDHVDPLWQGRAPLDLEAVAAVPGASDLYLLTGERGAEDATDNGANRLYLVRYPAGDPGEAEVVAYFRLPDLVDDLFNDRFEALAVLPAATHAPARRAWTVYLFKERTAIPERTPGYAVADLVQDGASWTLTARAVAGAVLVPAFLPDVRTRPRTQSDACPGPDGETIWVLDRWQRHLLVLGRDASDALVHRTTHDAWPLLADVPGERVLLEPRPPGLDDRPGFGRHEGLCFDAFGWLYLAADRGGGVPSFLTVLAPRAAGTDEAPR